MNAGEKKKKDRKNRRGREDETETKKQMPIRNLKKTKAAGQRRALIEVRYEGKEKGNQRSKSSRSG